MTKPKYSPPTRLLIFAGMIELMRPLSAFSKTEKERLADTLSGIAADLKKGASSETTCRFLIEIEADQ